MILCDFRVWMDLLDGLIAKCIKLPLANESRITTSKVSKFHQISVKCQSVLAGKKNISSFITIDFNHGNHCIHQIPGLFENFWMMSAHKTDDETSHENYPYPIPLYSLVLAEEFLWWVIAIPT